MAGHWAVGGAAVCQKRYWLFTNLLPDPAVKRLQQPFDG